MKETIKNIGGIVLPAVFSVSCATMHQEVIPEAAYQNQQEVISQLEAMTAAGEFPAIAAYVNERIDENPRAYMNEMYSGAEVAFRHAPHGVYMLAVEMYHENRKANMQNMYETQEWMSKCWFTCPYGLDHDE